MKRATAIAASLVAGATMALAGLAQAQMGPGYGMGTGMGPGYGMGPELRQAPGTGPFSNSVDPVAVADARLAALHAQFGITAAQEAAWQAFADAVRLQARDMDTMMDALWQGSGTAADRLVQRAQAMQQRAAGLMGIAVAFQALYGVLTPDQRALADARFGPAPAWGPGFGPFPG